MGMTRTWRLLALAGWIVLAGCNGGAPGKNATETPTADNRSKLDADLSMAIQNSTSAAQTIDVLIRTRGKIDARQLAALESQGARIGSVIGDVVTATVPLQSVSRIADLEFVVRIEMSKKQRLRQVH
ncbi:MAG: hypothetical protein ACM3NI_04130 [Bacteroidota bacterium]